MIEIWKDIQNYEGLYQISNQGSIRSLLRSGKCKRYLKPYITSDGYARVILSKNGKLKSHKIHRLVAETFIPNPDNLPQINHKDEHKLNNCVDNLEWCTAKYNINYGVRSKKCMISRRYSCEMY